MNIEQSILALRSHLNNPQALTIATAQQVCARIDPELFNILQVSAIPNKFDADLMVVLLSSETRESSELFSLLTGLDVVVFDAENSSWSVPKPVREALRQHFAEREPERFKQLSLIVAEFIGNTDDQALLLESICQRLAANQVGADQLLLKNYQIWRDQDQENLLENLNSSLIELLGLKHLQGLNLARVIVIVQFKAENSKLDEKLINQAIDLFRSGKDVQGEAKATQLLGRYYYHIGQNENALKNFITARSLLDSIDKYKFSKVYYLYDQGVICLEIARVLNSQEQFDQALCEYRKFEQTLFQIIELENENDRYYESLARTYIEMAYDLVKLNRREDAFEENEKALVILNDLLEKKPTNLKRLIYLTDCYASAANIYVAQGWVKDAILNYEAAIDIYRQMLLDNPDHLVAQIRLWQSHYQIGRIFYTQNSFENAILAYRTLNDLITNCKFNNNLTFERENFLAMSHHDLGSILMRQNNYQQAQKAFCLARKSFSNIAMLEPSKHVLKYLEVMCYKKEGEVLEVLGDMDQALQKYKIAKEMFMQLNEISQDKYIKDQIVFIQLYLICLPLKNQGMNNEALEELKQCIDNLDRFLETEPKNVKWEFDKVIALYNIANIYVSKQLFIEGFLAAQKSVRIGKRLLKIDRKNKDYQLWYQYSQSSLINCSFQVPIPFLFSHYKHRINARFSNSKLVKNIH